jgi:hypothetical protein
MGIRPWEYARMSSETPWRKTDKERLRPTTAQVRALERVLWRFWHCRRSLYTAALEQRVTAWERCHIATSPHRHIAMSASHALSRKRN